MYDHSVVRDMNGSSMPSAPCPRQVKVLVRFVHSGLEEFKSGSFHAFGRRAFAALPQDLGSAEQCTDKPVFDAAEFAINWFGGEFRDIVICTAGHALEC
jgi:hypothetical protein